MNLKVNDYKAILQFYHLPIPKNKKTLKQKAEHMLITKLCRCIKKIKRTNGGTEKKGIRICRKSVIQRKKIDFKRFSCKKTRKKRLVGLHTI